MKIKDIQTIEVLGHGYSTYVRVYTDEGLTGTGECIHGRSATSAIINDMKMDILKFQIDQASG